MFWSSFYIIVAFFSFGAVATVILNKKKDIDQAKGRWMKYFLYLIIVTTTIWFIYKDHMPDLAIGLLLVGAFEICRGWRSSRKGITFIGISTLLYCGLSFCFYEFCKMSTTCILYVYMIVFTFDGFAQLTGQLFGKRKILHRISPNKTVAGAVGGSLMGIATGLFMMRWLDVQGSAIWGAPIVICVSAFAGDGLASWYKRMCLLKDYSKLIPGHGGVLDRYDSFIFAGAVFGLLYG